MTDASPEAPDDDNETPTPPQGFQPEEPATRPPLRKEITAAVLLLVAVTSLGVPVGALWSALAPRVELVMGDSGLRYTEESPEGYIGDDGVFTFIGLGAGVLVAVTAWFLLRRMRGPLVLSALVLGSVLCQTVGWKLGRLPGRDLFESLRDTAGPGWSLFRPADLRMVSFDPGKAVELLLDGKFGDVLGQLQLGVLATMALAAVFVYTVLAGWSRYHSLHKSTEPPAPPAAEPAELPTMQTTSPQPGNS